MKLDYELRDEFLKGNLVLFVGAGFVRSYVSRMPLWNELLTEVFSTLTGDANEVFKYASPMFDEKGNRIIHSGEYLRLAQEFELVRQQENRKRVGTGQTELLSIHHQVQKLISYAYDGAYSAQSLTATQFAKASELPLNTWVTTNYDTFIEDTVLQEDIKRGGAVVFRRPIRNSDFADRSARGKTLYKIHGCVTGDPGKSIVITEDDYHRFLRQDRYIVNKLYTLFCERIVVFLGYSISDPNIQFIYNEVLFDQKLHDAEEELSFSRIRPAYFVSKSTIPAEQKAYYRYKKIRYIEKCTIESFFEQLCKAHESFQTGLAGVRDRIAATEEEYADLVAQFDWDTDPNAVEVVETERQDWMAKH
jgi:SIR2-like domain